MFYYCSKLTSITIPNGVTRIGKNAFFQCSSINSVSIPKSVTSIGDYAFQYCSNINSISVPNYVVNKGVYDTFLYSSSSITSVKILDDVKTIPTESFKFFRNLKQLVIPSSVTSIASSAFYSCGMDSVTIPSSVKTLYVDAFKNCGNLNKIKCLSSVPAEIKDGLPFGNSTSLRIIVPDEALDTYRSAKYWKDYGDRIVSVGMVVPQGLIAYEATVKANDSQSALMNVIGADKLDITYSLKVSGSINSYDFIIISNKMPNLKILDLEDASIVENTKEYYEGYHTEANTLSRYAIPNTITKLVLPKSLKAIGAGALANHSLLTSIAIPNGVCSIGEDAFYGCGKINSVIIPKGVVSLEKNAFARCTSLESVTFADGSALADIKEGVFDNCPALTSIVIPVEVKGIGSNAFRGCTKLSSVTISRNAKLSIIGERAFNACSALKGISLPTSVKKIEEFAFANSGLTELKIPSSVVTIGDGAFNCKNLKSIYTYTVEPTKIRQSTFGEEVFGSATLYVPEFSQMVYFYDTQWSQFRNLKTFNEPYNYLYINNDYTLNDNTGRIEGKPDGDFNAGSGFIVLGKQSQEMGTIHLMDDGEKVSSIIGDNNIKADKIVVDITANKDEIKFVTFPVDIKITDIKTDDKNLKVYEFNDGLLSSSTSLTPWVDITKNTNILKANVGYLLEFSKPASASVEIFNPASNKELKDEDTKTVLIEMNSNASADKNGWNCIGNQNISYYDIDEIGSSAPVTIMENNVFVAYKPGDDDFMLKPLQGFAVQKSNLVSEIVFKKESRNTYMQIEEIKASKSKVRKVQGKNDSRKIVNLTISDASGVSDKTRIVFNNSASAKYEKSVDAMKFMSPKSVTQLYTIDAQGMRYSINERPDEAGKVTLAFIANKSGQFTISATRQDVVTYLHDNERGLTFDLSNGGYTFHADAGTYENRFTLMQETAFTSIEEVMSKTGVEIKNANSGIFVGGASNHEVDIFAINGAIVASSVGDGFMALKAGTYVVKVDNTIVKIQVK